MIGRWLCRRGRHKWHGPVWDMQCYRCHRCAITRVDAFLDQLARRRPKVPTP